MLNVSVSNLPLSKLIMYSSPQVQFVLLARVMRRENILKQITLLLFLTDQNTISRFWRIYRVASHCLDTVIISFRIKHLIINLNCVRNKAREDATPKTRFLHQCSTPFCARANCSFFYLALDFHCEDQRQPWDIIYVFPSPF